jgi:hypothetical protein
MQRRAKKAKLIFTNNELTCDKTSRTLQKIKQHSLVRAFPSNADAVANRGTAGAPERLAGGGPCRTKTHRL